MFKCINKQLVAALVVGLVAVNVANSAVSSRVYTIDGSKLIRWAQANGHLMKSKQLTRISECYNKENILKVKRKKSSAVHKAVKPTCLFTLFKPGKLAPGWKVKIIMVLSNGFGEWHYVLKPHNKTSLQTIIRATYGRSDSLASHDIKIDKIILTGPATSKSWKQAFLAAH